MYRLEIRDDEGRSTVVPLERLARDEEITIGRKEGNSIRLTERNVSRQHAKLARRDGKVFVEDSSRYGIKINGQRVSGPTALANGDILLIGDYQLAFEIDDADQLTTRETADPTGGDATALVNLDKIAAIAAINAMGVNSGAFTAAAFALVGPAIQAVVASPGEGSPSDPDLDEYLGIYRSAWGEQAVVLWEDSLATMGLPTSNPMEALSQLVRGDGDTFHRERSDGALGESLIFERNAAGEIVSFSQHGNQSQKVE